MCGGRMAGWQAWISRSLRGSGVVGMKQPVAPVENFARIRLPAIVGAGRLVVWLVVWLAGVLKSRKLELEGAQSRSRSRCPALRSGCPAPRFRCPAPRPGHSPVVQVPGPAVQVPGPAVQVARRRGPGSQPPGPEFSVLLFLGPVIVGPVIAISLFLGPDQRTPPTPTLLPLPHCPLLWLLKATRRKFTQLPGSQTSHAIKAPSTILWISFC